MDKVLELTGSGGRFQVVLVVATQAIRIASVWGLFFVTFGIYEPPWKCSAAPDSNQINTTRNFLDDEDLWWNVTSHSWFKKTTTQNFLPGHRSNSSMTSLSQQYTEGSCSGSDVCTHFDFRPGSSTLVTEWNLVCDRQWITSAITTAQMSGSMVGSIIGGQLAESVGRKPTLYSFLGIFTILNVAPMFSLGWEMYTVLRFLLGVCIGVTAPLSFVYAVEFLGPKGRSFLSALPFWNIGVVMISLVVYCLKDWRYVQIATSTLSALALLTVFWVPESIRWLFAHQKIAEVNSVARKISRVNGKNVRDHYVENINAEHKPSRQNTYLDLFREKTYTHRTTALSLIRFCHDLPYLAIGFGISAFSGDFYFNFVFFSLSEISVCLLVLPVIHFLNRRHGYLLFLAIPFLCCVGVVFINNFVTWDIKEGFIGVLALVAKTSLQGAAQIGNVFAAELFPTVLRTLAANLIQVMAGLAGIVAPFLIPSNSTPMSLCFSIMAALLLVAGLLVVSLPETKGKPMIDVWECSSSSRPDNTEDIQTVFVITKL